VSQVHRWTGAGRAPPAGSIAGLDSGDAAALLVAAGPVAWGSSVASGQVLVRVQACLTLINAFVTAFAPNISAAAPARAGAPGHQAQVGGGSDREGGVRACGYLGYCLWRTCDGRSSFGPQSSTWFHPASSFCCLHPQGNRARKSMCWLRPGAIIPLHPHVWCRVLALTCCS
jgi:hypothetical protein